MKTARNLVASLLLAASLSSVCLGFTGCTPDVEYTKYSYQFYGTFDTIIQFVGYERSQARFDSYTKIGEDRFRELNEIFDVYHTYDGFANVKTINDNAGIVPVKVGKDLIALVKLSKEWYGKTGGKCNIAIGPVIAVWKKYRDMAIADEKLAQVPPAAELEEAARYCDLSKVIVDETAGTIYLQEKGMALDLGAVAKGYTCEIVAKELQSAGFTSCIVDGGGNIRLIGRPADGLRQRWGVGIQDPDADASVGNSSESLDIVYLHDMSFVTSGDYQRYYTVGDTRYCHLIDPVTLMPARYFRAVAISYPDSGIADFMSTTVFLLPYDEGRALVESIPGMDAIWIFEGDTMKMTDNIKQYMKTAGGGTSTIP